MKNTAISKIHQYKVVEIKSDEEWFTIKDPINSLTLCVNNIGSNSVRDDSTAYDRELTVYRTESDFLRDDLSSKMIELLTSDTFLFETYKQRLVGRMALFFHNIDSINRPLFTFFGFSDLNDLKDEINYHYLEVGLKKQELAVENLDEKINEKIENDKVEIIQMLEDLRKENFKQKIEKIKKKFK